MILARHKRLPVLLSLVLLGLTSCSEQENYGPTGKIRGKLTMDGKPLEVGHGVTFMEPMKGFLVLGLTDLEGNFEAKTFNGGNMPIGKYRVSIASPDPDLSEWNKLTPEQKFDRPQPTAKRVFPKRYLDMNTSKLEFDVKEGDNTFNINLDAK